MFWLDVLDVLTLVPYSAKYLCRIYVRMGDITDKWINNRQTDKQRETESLRICSYSLKKSWMANFIFCVVYLFVTIIIVSPNRECSYERWVLTLFLEKMFVIKFFFILFLFGVKSTTSFISTIWKYLFSSSRDYFLKCTEKLNKKRFFLGKLIGRIKRVGTMQSFIIFYKCIR